MRHITILQIIFSIFFIVFNLNPISVSATGNTLYVDATIGNDLNTGITENLPLKTITEASERVQAGDIVLVKNGIYSGTVNITHSGTATDWIIFKNFPGHSPKIVNDDTNVYDAVRVSGNYIEINGFDIEDKGLGNGLYIYNETTGNHHIRILNNILHDSACNGVGSRFADYLTIVGNKVYNNAFRSLFMCSGISLYQSSNFDQQPGFHNIISNNITYGNFNKTTYSGNITTDGNGIIIDDFRHSQSGNLTDPYTSSTLVENNISFNNGGRGVHVYQSNDVVVRNNTTFHNVKDPNLDGTYNGELTTWYSSNVSFYNNIAIPDVGKLNYIDAFSENNNWDYNLFGNIDDRIGENSNAVFGPNNIFSVNPKFVNPTEDYATANFRLQPSSPAIDKLSSNYPSIDYSGTARSQGAAADLGAFEYLAYQSNINSGGVVINLNQNTSPTTGQSSKTTKDDNAPKNVSPATIEIINSTPLKSERSVEIIKDSFKFLNCKDRAGKIVDANGRIVTRLPKGATVITADESGIIIAQSREYYKCVKDASKAGFLNCKNNMGYILNNLGRRVNANSRMYTVNANELYGKVFTSKNNLISCTGNFRP